MAISEARQQQLLAGCNSLEAKLFEFVPIQEVWSAEQINRQMQTAGKSGAEHKRVRAALGGLKDRGLIKEVKRDCFQREAVKIRELREAVSDVVTPPKLGDFADIKALKRIAVPYVPPAAPHEVTAAFEKEFSATIGGVLSKDFMHKAEQDVIQSEAKPEAKPEPVAVKEPVQMNAIAKAVPAEQTAADLALEVIGEITQEMDKLTDEYGARMNKLRERMEVVALEVEELRDAERKQMAKYHTFKALIQTLSGDDD